MHILCPNVSLQLFQEIRNNIRSICQKLFGKVFLQSKCLIQALASFLFHLWRNKYM